jgi:UDP-GlcNAc3NAcA epimerase
MKIVTIIGARPQFIKASVISRELKRINIKEVIIHTGQHFDKNMSEIFFEEMEIPKPDYNLNINGLSHGAMTGQMLEKIEEVLIIENPDLVLVYGDTNSTLAGALAAKKIHIKVAHIEAGLRSFNQQMPEEINRILTDRISDILFCPTDSAMQNLEKEGYHDFNCQIFNVGDIMFDASVFYKNKERRPNYNLPNKFILATLHRAENTDNDKKLITIFESFEEQSSKLPIVIPLHPRTKSKLVSLNYNFKNSKIFFIDPVGYLEMIWLLNNCKLVVTDSGGIQKEAFFFKKYCLTLREQTEWIELIENGCNQLVELEKEKILHKINEFINKPFVYAKELYGDGKTAEKIIQLIIN